MKQKIKILVRKNLKMSPFKTAAQCVHAALGLSETDAMMTVICLGVSDKKYFEFVESHPNCYRVVDAGYTEIEPGTETCCAFFEEDKKHGE